MPQVKKTIDDRKYGDVIVVDNVVSHANDPFFVKKVEDAKKVLSKLTLPENRGK